MAPVNKILGSIFALLLSGTIAVPTNLRSAGTREVRDGGHSRALIAGLANKQ